MKNLLFLIVLFSNAICAQQFKELDSIQFKQAVDQLVKDTGINYQLVSDRGDADKDSFMFSNPENKSDVLYIKFTAYFAGKNIDLELPGVKKWNILDIYGKYLSLFPIWKKYYQTDADKEKISKNNSAPMKGFPEHSFRRYEDAVWNISL